MSFTGTDYIYGGSSPAALLPNQTIQQAYPALALNGTETGATYQNIQEVAGDLYISSNASYNGTNWIQTDATKASYALRFRSNGSIVERVTAPSSAPTPIVWTTVFSINTAGNTVISGTLNVTGATTLAGVNVGGAITGATSITMSGALSGGTATFTAPLPLGSGGTGATSLAGANIAVNYANNNFSVGQTISGNVNLSSGGYQMGGNNVLYNDTANTFLQVYTGANAIYFRSSAAANLAHIPNAGGLVLDTGSLTAGSSTYGPTSATVNGTIIAGNSNAYTGSTSGDMVAARTGSGGAYWAGGNTSQGSLDYGLTVPGKWNFQGNAGGAGNLVLGGSGALTTGSSTYGPTSATVNGTIQGSSNGSTVSYLPPVYVAAGTIVPSTQHIVQDKITAVGASTSVTLSGAAAFASASSYTVYVTDTATGAQAVVTAQAAGSFTFTSTSTHVYSFMAIGS